MARISKSGLGIMLSELKDFEKHNLMLEQYSTPSEIAAEVLWNAYMNRDIDGKIILDAACGPGYLGIGALLLGAKRVFFVDKSKEALEILKENIRFIDDRYGLNIGKNAKIIESDIKDIRGNVFWNEAGNDEFTDGKTKNGDGNVVDVILQNPPFGTKEKHHDKVFLEKAFELCKVIYSFHKTSTKGFVEAISRDFGFAVSHSWRYDFTIKAVHKFHEKKRYNIDVTVFRLEKKRQFYVQKDSFPDGNDEFTDDKNNLGNDKEQSITQKKTL